MAEKKKSFRNRLPKKAIFLLLIFIFTLAAPSSALADPASFFDTDLAVGISRFKDVVNDAAGGAAVFYERSFDSSMSTNVFEVQNGSGGSAWVRVTQNGSAVNFSSQVNVSPESSATYRFFRTWSVSVYSWAEAYAEGITFEFFTDNTLLTPMNVNAFGIYTYDWGTCCLGPNYIPSGATQMGTAIYSIFDADPTTYNELIGNITQTIPSDTHFVAEIDDREEGFQKVTVIPNGRGEYFGLGGYIVFSWVAEDSVPPGSGSTPSIPPGNPDLTTATDLGNSSTDNLTSDTTPDFSVTYTPQNDIDFVNLYSGPAPSGPWTLIATSPAAGTTSETTVVLTSSTLAGGSYYIAARVENGYWHDESDPSPSPLRVTIDDTPPTMTITAAEVSDGDTSNNPTLSLTFTSSEPTTGFAAGDVVVTNGSIGAISGSGTTYTATLTPTADGPVTVNVPAASYTDSAGNDNLVADEFNWISDQTPPTVQFNPQDGETIVANSADIILTLSEAIRRASDNADLDNSNIDSLIILKYDDASGLDISFDATIDSANQVITINPDITLPSNQAIYVAIGTSVEDFANNPLADDSATFMSADENHPTLTSSSPSDGLAGVSVNTDLTLNFSESVFAQSGGTIEIHRSSDSSLFESISVTGAQISGNGTATIIADITGPLESLTDYYVLINGVAFDDADTNDYGGINSPTKLNFTTEFLDVTAPVVTISPADGATGVSANSNITISFDEAVRNSDDTALTNTNVGGLITLKETNGSGSDILFNATIDVAKQVITINPTSNFASSQVVYVAIGASVEDDSDNPISATNATFTVADTSPPTLDATSPVDESTSVGVSDNLVLTFNEAVNVGFGTIKIYKSSDNSVFESMSVTSVTQVSGGGTATITVNPANTMDYNTSYYVQIDATAFDDIVGNSYAGISDTTTWNFTTRPVGDADGDGMTDPAEGSGDRDGDGVQNDLDYDPTGYFYDEATGEIISGGLVSASGPGAITTFETGASGFYQFATDGTAGTYTLSVTLPPGHDWSASCLRADPPAYDPTGQPDPDMLGAGEDGTTGFLTSNACTTFYLTMDLAPGDPFIINNNFPLVARPLPATGFEPGRVTELAVQTGEKSYQKLGGMWLEVPALGMQTPIVGVPSVNGEWDVSWLGNNAGYLSGTAFPTWAGNTVITGHVWNADNQPGIFVDLRTLKFGDRVRIHAWGDVYTYQVAVNRRVSPLAPKAILEHKDADWITLFTCESFGEYWGDYGYRRMVQAVLVDVSPE